MVSRKKRKITCNHSWREPSFYFNHYYGKGWGIWHFRACKGCGYLEELGFQSAEDAGISLPYPLHIGKKKGFS